jgi:hypothetical protein
VEEEGDALAHQAAGRQSRAQDGWLGLCFEAMLIFRELEVSVVVLTDDWLTSMGFWNIAKISC